MHNLNSPSLSRRSPYLPLLLGLCLCRLCVTAQEAPPAVPDAIRLSPIVVTGTIGERSLSGITASVNLLEAEQLRLSNARYVGDLLNFLPSVSVRNEGILGRQGIELRGLGANCRRIQILVDGRPEKMSLFGCAVTQTLPLANVERIELARGPESVLYGSDAMGGVINIITKRRETDGQEGSWLASYGSHAQIHNRLAYGAKAGPLDLYLTYDRQQTHGDRPNSDYESDFTSLRLGYQLDDIWRAEVTSQFFEDDGENPGPDYNPARFDDWQQYRRWFWDAKLLAEWEDSKLTLNVYENYGKHHYHMPTYGDYWHSKDRTFGLSLSYQQTLLQQEDMKDVLTLGYDYEHQWAKPLDDYTDTITAARKFYDFGPYETQLHEVYAFNEFSLGKIVNTTGLRIHWNDLKHHVEWIPQTAFLWHALAQTDLKAKVSKGFRLPRFSETFLFPAHNEELDPEEVWNYELGIKHWFIPEQTALEATFFIMDVRNQVRTIRRPNVKPPKFNINSNPFTIKGLEVEFSHAPSKDLSLSLCYTLTDCEEDDQDTHANRDGIPQHMLAAMATYTLGKYTFTAQAKWIHDLYSSNQIDTDRIEKMDDFILANVSASYELSQQVRLFLGVNNLLNADYQEYNGYDAPGLTVHGGIEISF